MKKRVQKKINKQTLMKSYALTLAKNIARLRSKKGLTQDELAHAAGLYQPHISDIERGLLHQRGLHRSTLAAIANALGVEIADLESESTASLEAHSGGTSA